ncbi:hypothetical protein Q73_11270 [Bacillus coahuilensis m2-6]|uniref:YtzH-like protein n=1 Tax=Bacillus coahuilensis p1.1.43 TaxID=1150625 RepID=A0A147K6S7_9BACI|nr:YtzH-like family protein [Bacillus coahuilensis]KUP05534.1 hypothetical protein Q75_11870 [Bacillus coahuilensis p1.1.43]KUP06720.1 hypothetical protein Q73_11270 [Bacillus coahuilensis m2-6]
MPLTYHNQLSLLQDILTNHLDDCCGTVAECEQVERLVKSLMVNQDVQQAAKPLLEEIYRYGQEGKYTKGLEQHIHTNRQSLENWVEDMNTYF